MTPDPIGALPDDIARVVRLTRVTFEARTLLRHTGPWSLDARIPVDPTRVPLVLRQLLKLALLPGHDVHLAAATLVAVDDAPSLVVSRAGSLIAFDAAALGADLKAIVHRLVAELTLPSDLIAVSETLALELAREETVRKLASRMLEAADLDEALYAMLLGITSGYGAGFHRAALFTYDVELGAFCGSIAIGPRDEAEAHQIWEAIESEDRTLDQTLDDYKTRANAGGYQAFVQTLKVSEGEGRELRAAHEDRIPQVFREPPESATLALLLSPATEYVLSVIQPRGTRLGLIVADNAYGRQPIVPAQVEFLRALVAPTSFAWDTRSLLRKVDALARHDALTGLYNRRELDERMSVEQSRCARAKRPISIAIIDLDHFKDVNDTHGHGVGDSVLRRVGMLLSETLRQHDVPVRYGGDEFVLMLPEGTKDELLAVSIRIGQRALAEGISLSIGGATWPEDTGESSSLIELADGQLYEAKAQGRGRVCVIGRESVSF